MKEIESIGANIFQDNSDKGSKKYEIKKNTTKLLKAKGDLTLIMMRDLL
jgi:hypothetical protein